MKELEDILKRLDPHPLDKMVWVGKNFSKKDLCDALKEVLHKIKRDCQMKISGEKLAVLMVTNGIVQPEAVDDSVDYDGGKTLDAIYRVAENLSSQK